MSLEGRIARIESKLERILGLLQHLTHQETAIMATQQEMQAEYDQLTADVTANTNAEQAAVAAFQGVSAQLAAAVAAASQAGATDAQLAQVKLALSTLEANTTALSTGIPANTLAAPPAPAAA